ncbi:MAG: hypothetical protein ACXAB4_00120, partial [Candidatus Hodarchaeales archaeon]
LNPSFLKLANSNVQSVACVLHGYGYDLYFAKRRRMEPLGSLPTGARYENVFCFHDGAESRAHQMVDA